MPMVERIKDHRQIRHWYGEIPVEYLYTVGVAGEKFFREIKENGRIMGTKCRRCGIVYVPPRTYCERCFEKLEEWVDVGKKGTVHTYTIAYVDVDESRLREPVVYAVVKIDGTSGGIVHKLGEVDLKDVDFSMPVEAVLKPPEEREGSINDIVYFKPIK
ncbi:MAG: Zn-ribbon domain-containing OB-fold protein [Candidatus Geothermarchaeales archaeon]